MRTRTQLVVTAVAAGAVGASLAGGVGHLTAAYAAQARASRVYTLRVGDRILVPSVGQRCTVFVEGRGPELFCSRPHGAHHQVTFFHDSVQVWKAGNPNNPVWSGEP